MLYVLFDYGWNVTLCIGIGLAQVRGCCDPCASENMHDYFEISRGAFDSPT
jgi:hypothetical protein